MKTFTTKPIFNFYATIYGRKVSIHIGQYKRPQSTKAWKLLLTKLDQKEFISSVGYEVNNNLERKDNGLRFKLGKALFIKGGKDFYYFPNDKEAAIIFKSQLRKQLN